MRRRKRIVRLEQALRSALGRGQTPTEASPASPERPEDVAQRLEAARRQLKATVPPPQD